MRYLDTSQITVNFFINTSKEQLPFLTFQFLVFIFIFIFYVKIPLTYTVTGIVNLGVTGFWGQIIDLCCGVCPAHRKMLNSIPNRPPDACREHPASPVVTIETICRCCQKSPGPKTTPGWEPLHLIDAKTFRGQMSFWGNVYNNSYVLIE